MFKINNIDTGRKTNEIANLRIHVECDVNRIKFPRVLKSTVTITLLKNDNDIVRTCAALCNLLSPLIDESNSKS